jgi:hypothetical protein
LSNKEIAARLQIALPTVQRHVHKVLSKLAANSRLEVAAFCQDGAAPPDASAPAPPRSEADLVPTSPFELDPIPPVRLIVPPGWRNDIGYPRRTRGDRPSRFVLPPPVRSGWSPRGLLGGAKDPAERGRGS